MRVLLYAKMLQETENEETRLFVKFLSLVTFWLRGPRPPGYAYDFEIRLRHLVFFLKNI